MLIVKHFVAPQNFVKKTKFWASVVRINTDESVLIREIRGLKNATGKG